MPQPVSVRVDQYIYSVSLRLLRMRVLKIHALTRISHDEFASVSKSRFLILGTFFSSKRKTNGRLEKATDLKTDTLRAIRWLNARRLQFKIK